jgi:pyrroloquinoline quinone biosynthesis protein D
MTQLSPATIPRLPHGVRLKFDQVRNVNVLLAPERAFELDPTAAEVLSCIDGRRSIGEIVDVLAVKFTAERAIIEADVIDMLAGLVGRRVLEVAPQAPATRLDLYGNGT